MALDDSTVAMDEFGSNTLGLNLPNLTDISDNVCDEREDDRLLFLSEFMLENKGYHDL